MTQPTPQNQEIVDVDVLSFDRLFDPSLMSLGVDTYQRGFVWSDEKIQQLIDDLAEFQNRNGSFLRDRLDFRAQVADLLFLVLGEFLPAPGSQVRY